MKDSIAFRIVNWKLTILAFVFIALFCSLGCWQLSRAQQKKSLLNAFNMRIEHAPLNAQTLDGDKDLRYFRAELEGSFDNEHSVLLDNKIVEGRVGYEIYTPFFAHGLSTPILIDRGFVPLGRSRNDIPVIRAIPGPVKITGMLNLPPAYVALGEMNANPTPAWPLVVEYIDLKKLWISNIYPYILMLDPKDPAAYTIEWKAVVTMPPERHVGYAVQWFALALTLLILFFVLNRKPEVTT